MPIEYERQTVRLFDSESRETQFNVFVYNSCLDDFGFDKPKRGASTDLQLNTNLL